MFRTVPLSIIRSFSLYTQKWYMSYSLRAGPGRNWSCSQAVSKPVWHRGGRHNLHWWCNLFTGCDSPNQSRTMVSSSVQAGLAACEWKTTGIAVVCIVVFYWARSNGEKSESNFLSVLPVSQRKKVSRPCPCVLMLRATCTRWDPLNPLLAGNMPPATQCSVACGYILNKEMSFSPFRGQGRHRTPEQFWQLRFFPWNPILHS